MYKRQGDGVLKYINLNAFINAKDLLNILVLTIFRYTHYWPNDN